jgi:multidrug efflux pump subunit AcrA (membrane-fusion protein)
MLQKKAFIKYGYILFLAGAVLFTTACGAQTTLQPISAEEQVKAEQASIIEAAGKIKAKDTRNIILDFPTAVVNIPVEDGQRVTQGEELATLDIHEIQQQIQDKQNALVIERLQLAKLQNDSDNSAAR